MSWVYVVRMLDGSENVDVAAAVQSCTSLVIIYLSGCMCCINLLCSCNVFAGAARYTTIDFSPYRQLLTTVVYHRVFLKKSQTCLPLNIRSQIPWQRCRFCGLGLLSQTHTHQSPHDRRTRSSGGHLPAASDPPPPCMANTITGDHS